MDQMLDGKHARIPIPIPIHMYMLHTRIHRKTWGTTGYNMSQHRH
jgi:hypothetical protein